ncbi:MAG TPA: dihydrofolate reductase, partial [Rhodocyclaceae bacterium]|nr:dihydrofolate reductase [Rhodocyclaceae bacterium]
MNSEVKRKTRISLIAAVAQNGIIGRGNALPWRLSDDLKRFKALTLDHSIVMGRKTWDSLGRPLPNRRHIVL